MHSGLISHPDYKLEYFLYGTGPRTLIVFHGFNNNAQDFESLGRIAGERYTIIAINIFFHGNSTVENHLIESGFSNDDLRQLFGDIFNVRPADKYTLMGYSLGGRICLRLFELFPTMIDEIVLLAPDGIRINPFYKFLTGTGIGRGIMRYAVHNPGLFESLAGFLRRTRIVSEKRYQFARSNFENEEKREQVYKVWMTLRNVRSERTSIKNLLQKTGVRLHLFFGKFDKIIPVSIGRNFQKGAEKQIRLNVLEEGHRLVKPETLQKVMNLIKNDDLSSS